MNTQPIATLPRQRPSKAQSLLLIHAVAKHFLIGLAGSVDELESQTGRHKDVIGRLKADRTDLYDDLYDAYRRKKAALLSQGEGK